MKCSAVVLSFNRTGNLGVIVDNLCRHDWIEEVLIWHQGRPLGSAFASQPGARLFDAQPNLLRMGRFRAMDQCRNDWVLVQDDDTLPENLDQLWQVWCGDPVRIAALLNYGHLRSDGRRRWGRCHEVLIGWGAIVDRRWRYVFNLWIHRYGEDDLLLRKADRVFAILQQRHHNVIQFVGQSLPGATADDAEWKQPDHDAATVEARKRCLNGILGFGLRERDYAKR